jgi:macrolide transport system ATP-binding/permease protein
VIRARGLRRIYSLGGSEIRALDGVDLDIGPGEFVALVGASGSGKSTLMHVLGLLDQPDEGSYRLLGAETAHLSEDARAELRSRSLGFVFQQFNLLPRTAAEENVALPRLYHPDPLLPGEAAALLKRVGLGERLRNTPAQLSGGQQQRVAIARALLNRPTLLFADEPTGNLDTKSSAEIMALFKQLHAQGLTIVLVTHEHDIAAHARRVITLRDGRIISDRGRGAAAPSRRPSKALPAPAAEAPDPRRRLAAAGRALQGYWRQAFRALLANRLRTALSMLGILIGVAAVVTVLAVGAGAQQSMKQQLASLGTNLLMLRPGAPRMGGVSLGADSGEARFMPEDVRTLLREVPLLSRASPELDGRVQAVAEGKNWNTRVAGVSPDFAGMRAAEPALGRFFTEQEDLARARVAVVGVTVARNLFGDVNPLGRQLKLNRATFTVIGVLPAKGSSGFRDEDDRVLIPVRTAMYRVLGRDRLENLTVEVRDGSRMAEAEEAVKAAVRRMQRLERGEADNFRIFNMAEMQQAVQGVTKTVTNLLSAVAAISLLVGGIGIMNILLVSVTERTREIGLRKALGARQMDIQAQFLVEAVAISFLGGVSGLALGAGIAFGVGHFAGWAIHVSAASVALALSFSIGVGVFFGFWPARQASKLDPISALRFE